MKKLVFCAALLFVLGLAAAAAAENAVGPNWIPASAAESQIPPNLIPTFDLYFQSYAYGANDSDFDHAKLLHQPAGQTVGFVLTTIRPGLTWSPADILTLRWQPEIGDNLWGQNDLYNNSPTATNSTIFREKEIWADVHTPTGSVGGRVGYMYAYDPTHLVLDAHMGMAQFYLGFGGGKRLTIEVGQSPDDSFAVPQTTPNQEVRLMQNSFQQSNAYFASIATLPLGPAVLSPAVFFNWNRLVVDRPVGVLSAVCNLTYKPAGNMDLSIDGAFQWGTEKRAALDGSNITLVAGAGQVNYSVEWPIVGLRSSALAFSGGDHNREGRRLDTGFQFSGWARADTMMMTLNWLHDLYNDIDEAAAAAGTGFAMVDQKIWFNVGGDVSLFAIVGSGMTMSHEQTGNSEYVGTEGHLGMQWSPLPNNHLTLHLIAGGMLPGVAAAELVNTTNKRAIGAIYQGQAALTVAY